MDAVMLFLGAEVLVILTSICSMLFFERKEILPIGRESYFWRYCLPLAVTYIWIKYTEYQKIDSSTSWLLVILILASISYAVYGSLRRAKDIGMDHWFVSIVLMLPMVWMYPAWKLLFTVSKVGETQQPSQEE